eukprot:10349331-Lingulodinium_polyedra.AAC.1
MRRPRGWEPQWETRETTTANLNGGRGIQNGQPSWPTENNEAANFAGGRARWDINVDVDRPRPENENG